MSIVPYLQPVNMLIPPDLQHFIQIEDVFGTLVFSRIRTGREQDNPKDPPEDQGNKWGKNKYEIFLNVINKLLVANGHVAMTEKFDWATTNVEVPIWSAGKKYKFVTAPNYMDTEELIYFLSDFKGLCICTQIIEHFFILKHKPSGLSFLVGCVCIGKKPQLVGKNCVEEIAANVKKFNNAEKTVKKKLAAIEQAKKDKIAADEKAEKDRVANIEQAEKNKIAANKRVEKFRLAQVEKERIADEVQHAEDLLYCDRFDKIKYLFELISSGASPAWFDCTTINSIIRTFQQEKTLTDGQGNAVSNIYNMKWVQQALNTPPKEDGVNKHK